MVHLLQVLFNKNLKCPYLLIVLHTATESSVNKLILKINTFCALKCNYAA